MELTSLVVERLAVLSREFILYYKLALWTVDSPASPAYRTTSP